MLRARASTLHRSAEPVAAWRLPQQPAGLHAPVLAQQAAPWPQWQQATSRPSCRAARTITRVAATEPAPATSPAAGAGVQPAETFTFACPICFSTQFVVKPGPSMYQACRCGRCGRSFAPGPRYLDLTLTSGVSQQVYQQQMWQGTELFRQPLVSWVYERGWRQNFAGAGFPGPDKEFAMAMDYLAPAAGGLLVDVSCGTGLFTRLFARSRAFSGVVALDFSESMLSQAQQYFDADPGLASSTPIAAVRADVGRLPFATGSVDAIHAGAAIHCWPNPQAAMAEISRVLRPGGVFVATTFLTPLAPLGELLGDATVRPLSQAQARSSRYRLFEEGELADLVASAGLTGFKRTRQFRFIMLAASKPTLNPFQPSRNSTFRYWEEDELIDLVNAVGLTAYRRTRQRLFIMLAVTKPTAAGAAE